MSSTTGEPHLDALVTVAFKVSAALEPVPRQFVSDVTYDSAEKHEIRCDCTMCQRAWSGRTIYEYNNPTGVGDR
jgi:hypothetical protein